MSRFRMATAVSVMLCWAALRLPAQFEVASVKASAAGSNIRGFVMRGGPGTNSPGQITYTNVTVRMLVTKAWNLRPYQLSGPDSIDQVRFDIVAKVPAGIDQQQFLTMLRRLLEERIGLQTRRVPKEMAVYEMVIARGGLKLKDAESAPANSDVGAKVRLDKDGFVVLPPGVKAANESGGPVWRISARMLGIPDLLEIIEKHSGRPVINKTGLDGKFDFTLAFARESSALFSPAMIGNAAGKKESREAAIAPAPVPAFLEAVESQLGLKLQPARTLVDTIDVMGFRTTPVDS